MQTRLRLQFGNIPRVFAVIFSLALLCQAQAQVIVGSTPAVGATGVSPNTTVVFTFSAAVLPSTAATFYDNGTPVAATPSWNGFTSVTYTPVSGFPAGKMIVWVVAGMSQVGQPVNSGGFFTTSTGGGSGGSGTNAITSFTLGKMHAYQQSSTSAPTLHPLSPYAFDAITTLSSNRTATNIQLTLPSSAVSNLVQNPTRPEAFSLYAYNANLTTFDNTFASGSYSFLVKAAASNQTVAVNFPATLAQPPAPHLTNYTAAQTVNPAQAFTLAWDPFAGGGSTDYVYVAIGDVITSTNFGLPGALPGTATTFTIPAGTLQANSNYDSMIGFYRAVSVTNGNNYVTTVYRATMTGFTLTTLGTNSTPLILTNGVVAPSNFSFDVLCATGQTVTVQYRTNLAAGSWQTLFTTNSPASRFRATAPQATTNRTLFFRAKNGT